MENIPDEARQALPLSRGEEVVEAWHVWHYSFTTQDPNWHEGLPMRFSNRFFDHEGYLFLTSRRLLYVERAGLIEGYRILPQYCANIDRDTKCASLTSPHKGNGLVVNGAAYRLMRTPASEAVQSIRDVATRSSAVAPLAEPQTFLARPALHGPPSRGDERGYLFSGEPLQLVTCPNCLTLTPGDEPRCGACGARLRPEP